MQIFLTPDSWCQLTGIVILDPDGWDRSAANFQDEWNKPLCFEEFYGKAVNSTTRQFPHCEADELQAFALRKLAALAINKQIS
jgi:hypothetical protein